LKLITAGDFSASSRRRVAGRRFIYRTVAAKPRIDVGNNEEGREGWID
jgi:hypothetical protein